MCVKDFFYISVHLVGMVN